MPRTNNLVTALEQRRGTVERIDNAQAQYFAVTGEIEVNGVGEAIFKVLFPVYFTSKPRYHYGHEMGPGQLPTAGSLPTLSSTVIAWDETVRDDGTTVYSSATFGIVTTGITDQVMILQWHMDGVGLRGPIPDTDS